MQRLEMQLAETVPSVRLDPGDIPYVAWTNQPDVFLEQIRLPKQAPELACVCAHIQTKSASQVCVLC
jgi:hypothetical protein